MVDFPETEPVMPYPNEPRQGFDLGGMLETAGRGLGNMQPTSGVGGAIGGFLQGFATSRASAREGAMKRQEAELDMRERSMRFGLLEAQLNKYAADEEDRQLDRQYGMLRNVKAAQDIEAANLDQKTKQIAYEKTSREFSDFMVNDFIGTISGDYLLPRTNHQDEFGEPTVGVYKGQWFLQNEDGLQFPISESAAFRIRGDPAKKTTSTSSSEASIRKLHVDKLRQYIGHNGYTEQMHDVEEAYAADPSVSVEDALREIDHMEESILNEPNMIANIVNRHDKLLVDTLKLREDDTAKQMQQQRTQDEQRMSTLMTRRAELQASYQVAPLDSTRKSMELFDQELQATTQRIKTSKKQYDVSIRTSNLAWSGYGERSLVNLKGADADTYRELSRLVGDAWGIEHGQDYDTAWLNALQTEASELASGKPTTKSRINTEIAAIRHDLLIRKMRYNE